ncbi:MAG: energy transducer TonB [Pontixanthobacter sp.]
MFRLVPYLTALATFAFAGASHAGEQSPLTEAEWTFASGSDFCHLRYRGRQSRISLSISTREPERALLTLFPDAADIGSGGKATLQLSLSRIPLTGITNAAGADFYMGDLYPSQEPDLLQATSAAFTKPDGTVRIFDLPDGMAKLRAFTKCRIGLGHDAETPDPVPPRIAEPTLVGAFPAHRLAEPISPGFWVTGYDYPAIALRNDWQGVVHFAVTVAKNGRVADCRITRSSGHELLDRTTCDILSERSRFEPATDAQGMLVESTYESVLRWQIPQPRR